MPRLHTFTTSRGGIAHVSDIRDICSLRDAGWFEVPTETGTNADTMAREFGSAPRVAGGLA